MLQVSLLFPALFGRSSASASSGTAASSSTPASQPTATPAPAIPTDTANFSPAVQQQIAAIQTELASIRSQLATLEAKNPAPVTPAPAPKPKPVPAKPKTAYGEPWKPSPGSLHGTDTSNWQSGSEFNTSVGNNKWTCIKATQGTGYTDPSFASRWAELGKKVQDGQMDLRMAYCFLDPGNGKAQAQHFLNTLGIKGKLPAGTRLALDWEGAALNDTQCLKDAANYIYQVTGLWPTIYVQGSMESVAHNSVPQAPIWEAAYGSSINRNVPFFQYSDGGSSNIDQDVFNGSEAALRKFAGFA